MNLQALRQAYAALCDQQQAILNKVVSESRSMTSEEKSQINALQTQINDMDETIKAAEKIVARTTDLDKPADKAFRPSPLADTEDKLDDGGFKNVGEFLYSVKNGDSKGRLKNLSTGDAGILIPPAFSQNILQIKPEDEIVMPRANNIPAGNPPDAPFSIPYFNQGSNGELGGVSLTWTAEGKEINNTQDPDIEDLTLQPQEVSGLATINNKTLANWDAAGGFIQGLLRQAFVTGRDYKFLRGSGAGCPLGVLNAPGAIKVKRKTAGTIAFDDAAKMLSRLLPEAMSSAIFVASITALPAIVTMADGNGRLIYIQGDATRGVPNTLLGIPVLWTGKTPVVGTEGDLALISFQHYLIKPGSGPFVAISEHVKFTSNKTVFRIVANMDGQPWVKDPLKLQDGLTTVSPYVILQ